MTSSQIETDAFIHIDKEFYNHKVREFWPPFFHEFNRIIKTFIIFNSCFFILGLLELILFTAFFTLLAKSSILAISLASLFLTAFSYFVLRIYFQVKKPEQLSELKNDFIYSFKKVFPYQNGIAEHHFALSNALCLISASLQDKEYLCYPLPKWLHFLSPWVQRFSCWCYWEDVQKMRELLLFAAIEEHLQVIKIEPTNLELHASLANVYVTLSNLYYSRQREEDVNALFAPKHKISSEMHEKFRTMAERAIEEFKILKDYAPNDPWVHAQLASSYHDLQMPLEEIKEYEVLITLRPEDNEILFKLGVLYFEQGFNAKGLQIYEELKQMNYRKAEQLIEFYGSYFPSFQ